MDRRLLIALLAACGSSKDPPSTGSNTGSAVTVPTALPPRGPVDITLKPPLRGNLMVNDGFGQGFYHVDENLVFTAQAEGPKGTQLRWQDQTATLEDGPLLVKLDFRDVALRAPLGTKVFELPIVVTAPSKPATTAVLAISSGRETDLLAKVTAGPVAFPGDDKSTHRTDVAVVLYADSFGVADTITKSEAKVIRLFDVDFIVLRKQLDRVFKDCGTFTNGKQSVRRKIMARDIAETIYERRTGKLVAKQSFKAGPATKACEKTFDLWGDVSDGKYETVDAMYSETEEHAWVASFLTAVPGAEIDVPPTTAAGSAKGIANVAPVASTDAGTGFPTVENLHARMTKLGYEPKAPDFSSATYPRSVAVRTAKTLDQPCATLYDFGNASAQQHPTRVHVGERRAIWATIDDPAHLPELERMAAVMPKLKPEEFSQLPATLAGTGLVPSKTKSIPSELIGEPWQWTLYAAGKDGYMAVDLHVLYWGHLLAKGSEVHVVVNGERVMVVGCAIADEARRKDALAKLQQ